MTALSLSVTVICAVGAVALAFVGTYWLGAHATLVRFQEEDATRALFAQLEFDEDDEDEVLA